MRKVGFIGVGIMGKSMVRNLMKAGFELHIYARNRAKVEDVIGEGALFHDSIAACVKDARRSLRSLVFRRMWKKYTSMKEAFWNLQMPVLI